MCIDSVRILFDLLHLLIRESFLCKADLNLMLSDVLVSYWCRYGGGLQLWNVVDTTWPQVKEMMEQNHYNIKKNVDNTSLPKAYQIPM